MLAASRLTTSQRLASSSELSTRGSGEPGTLSMQTAMLQTGHFSWL